MKPSQPVSTGQHGPTSPSHQSGVRPIAEIPAPNRHPVECGGGEPVGSTENQPNKRIPHFGAQMRGDTFHELTL